MEKDFSTKKLADAINIPSILDLTPPPKNFNSEKKEGWVAAMRLFCKEDVASRREAIAAYRQAVEQKEV